MAPIWGFDPPEPDLPSGAGTTLSLPDFAAGKSGDTLPLQTERFDPTAIREPSAALPVSDEPRFLGLTRDQASKIATFAAGVEDAIDAIQGKTGTKLEKLQTRRATATGEARKEKREEERLGLERGRFSLEQIREARQIQTQQMQESRAFVTDASNLAGRLTAIPDESERTSAINAMVEEARRRGGDRIATVVTGILRNPDVGKQIGPLLRYLPETMAPALMQEGALLFHAGKGTDAQAKAEAIALPAVTDALFSRMRAVKNSIGEDYKDKPIPLSLLEAAINAANPSDRAGTNPEVNLLRGVGDVYGKAHPHVKEALGSLGFEVPGVAAKVAEQRAIEGAKPLPLAPDIQKALTAAGAGGIIKTFDPDNPIHIAAFKAAEESATKAATEKGRAIAAATGREAATIKTEAEAKAELGTEGAARLIHPKSLASPPATMTNRQARDQGFVAVTPEQRQSLFDLQQSRTIIDQIDVMSTRLITAKSPAEAAIQGGRLTTGAVARTNELATTYAANRQAFVGILSRTLGGERGVLTDRDIRRIDASLPGFFDTSKIREAKMGLLRELMTVAEASRRGAVLGEAVPTGSRERVQTLIDKIEGVGADAAEERLLRSLKR